MEAHAITDRNSLPTPETNADVAESARPTPPAAATPWSLPYLVGMALPLGVLSGNAYQLGNLATYQLVIGLAAAACFDLTSRWLLRSSPARSLLAALGVYWFIAYGNFDLFLHVLTGASLAQSWLVWSATLALLAVILQAGRQLPLLQKVGAILQISLIVMVGLQVFALRGLAADLLFQHDPELPVAGSSAEPAPDIYYIILDGYARADNLAALYHHDNRAFLGSLEQRGFQVASRSRSNYNQTSLSLASSLNLEYLDDLGLQPHASRIPLVRMMADSVVVRFLKERGYTAISLDTGYTVTNQVVFDERVAAPAGRGGWPLYPPTDEFQLLALNLTALAPVLQANLRNVHRARTLQILDRLPELRQGRNGPVFVLAHLLLPHPPFLFDAEGNSLDGPRVMKIEDGTFRLADIPVYRAGYRGQLEFANRQVLDCLDRILAASTRPAVIILQGDHGPNSHCCLWLQNRLGYFQERYCILNAVRANLAEPLPDDLTPVNTFRILFNRYFGTQLALRPNRVIFAPYDNSYLFEDVTGEMANVTPAVFKE